MNDDPIIQDRKINGKFYRVILQPIGPQNRDAPVIGVWVGSGDISVGERGNVLDGSLTEIKKRSVRGDESDGEALREGWLIAEAHARD